MNEKIKENVKAYISSFSNTPIAKIKDDYILKKQPLMLDEKKIVFLAIALRGYVKSLNPTETVLAKEIKKKDLSVRGTYELIIKKIQS